MLQRSLSSYCFFGLTTDFICLLMQIQHHLIPSSAPLLTVREVWFALRCQHRHCKPCVCPSENKLDMHYEAVMLPVSVYSTDLQLVKTSQETYKCTAENRERDCEQTIQNCLQKYFMRRIFFIYFFIFFFFFWDISDIQCSLVKNCYFSYCFTKWSGGHPKILYFHQFLRICIHLSIFFTDNCVNICYLKSVLF